MEYQVNFFFVVQISMMIYFSWFADKSWLHGAFISIYSDVLTIGYGSKFVVLNSKYEKDLQQKVFGSSLKNVQLNDENEIITSILSFSVTGGSSYVDWTCIVLGLSTGCIQFYSENGTNLYENQFHNENVLNIRLIGEEVTIFIRLVSLLCK